MTVNPSSDKVAYNQGLDLIKNNGIIDFSMLIIAKRRSGKNVLLKDLISRIYQDYENIYLFSNTIDMPTNQELYDFIPKENKFLPRIDIVNDLVTTQKSNPNRPHIMFIFDDFINDKAVKNAKEFSDLFILGRHYSIAVIALSQSFSRKEVFGKTTRSNCDYIITFKPGSELDYSVLHEDYLSGIIINNKPLTFNETVTLISKITSVAYRALIIDNTKTDGDLHSIIHSDVARIHIPKFISSQCPDNKGTTVKSSQILDEPVYNFVKPEYQFPKI